MSRGPAVERTESERNADYRCRRSKSAKDAGAELGLPVPNRHFDQGAAGTRQASGADCAAIGRESTNRRGADFSADLPQAPCSLVQTDENERCRIADAKSVSCCR